MDPLLFEIDGPLGIITLNRPETRNSLSPEMIKLWVAALEECRTNPDVHIIIITGAGNSFCYGGDTNRLEADTKRAMTALEIKEGFRQGLHQIPLKLEQIDKPVIAAVNGPAYGAGFDVALHADVRFAASSATFRVTYSLFGLVPGNGGTYFLPKLVGESKALELFWSADLIDAGEAHRIGLVNKVFPDESLLDETKKWARMVAGMAPLSVRLIKRSVRQGRNLPLETTLDMISSHMTVTKSSYDHAEGLRAYREKRPPEFKGY